jgi:hypothetical protein
MPTQLQIYIKTKSVICLIQDAQKDAAVTL